MCFLTNNPGHWGFLSNPIETYPGLFVPGSMFPPGSFLFRLFTKFPYCLPTIIAFCIAFTLVVLAFFVLEETLPNKKLVILDDRVPLLADDIDIDNEDHYSHDDDTMDSLQTVAEPDSPPSLFKLLNEKTVWGLCCLV